MISDNTEKIQPLVSIVITTYKGTENLRRAICSAKFQTYKNTEIIVVDDNGVGTSEQQETEKIVGDFFNVIYIAHDTNKNGSVARNTGIKAAHGAYVALLDDDDSFRSKKIEKQIARMQEYPEAKLCYTGMDIHYMNGKIITEVQDYSGYIFDLVMQREVKGQTSTLLFSRDAALDIGGFDESFRRHQDWEFLDRMSYRYNFTVVPEVCVDRYILNRTCAKNPQKYEENRLFYLKKMEPYILKLDNKARKKCYRHHYRSIAKEYLKSNSIIKACKYFALCGNPFVTAYDLIDDYKKSTFSK